jgi:hypothetical protein
MTEETTPTHQKKPFYKRWWFIALAVIVAIGFIGSLGDDEDSPTTTLAAPDTTSTTTPEANTTTTADSTSTTSSSSTTSSTTSSTSTTSTTSTTTSTTAPPETTTTAAGPETSFGNGTWLVSDEIAPGVYQTTESVSSCYWERLSGLGGTFDEIIANANVSGQGIVEIQEGDEAFSVSGCGDWIELTANSEPLTSFDDGWWAVGEHIAPGRYRSSGGDTCYWERLSGFSGEFDDIISNDIVEGQAIVEISDGDAGFHTSGCGIFELMG